MIVFLRPFAATLSRALMITVPIASFIPLAGCERKEKIIEVNTPGKEIKVERDRDTGRVEVEVRDK